MSSTLPYLRGYARHRGMTEDIYRALLKLQGGRCGCCGRVFDIESIMLTVEGAYGEPAGTMIYPRRPMIDHEHGQGRAHGHEDRKGCSHCIRGLLCYDCNADEDDCTEGPCWHTGTVLEIPSPLPAWIVEVLVPDQLYRWHLDRECHKAAQWTAYLRRIPTVRTILNP